jgi:hypothetical protein
MVLIGMTEKYLDKFSSNVHPILSSKRMIRYIANRYNEYEFDQDVS